LRTDDIVVGKVFRRLMWFIFILQIASSIDRIGFAGCSVLSLHPNPVYPAMIALDRFKFESIA